MIRFDKNDYEEIKQIISSMNIENVSYAGVFSNIVNEFMKNHDCNFTYCRANNSINTTEIKDMQIMIFKAMRELGMNYKSMVFADSKNSVLKNRVLKEFVSVPSSGDYQFLLTVTIISFLPRLISSQYANREPHLNFPKNSICRQQLIV